MSVPLSREVRDEIRRARSDESRRHVRIREQVERESDVECSSSGYRQSVLPLSRRERDVLGRIADGDTDVQAARALSISPETVKTHVAHARRKLGARTRAHAVAVAYRQGMIQ